MKDNYERALRERISIAVNRNFDNLGNLVHIRRTLSHFNIEMGTFECDTSILVDSAFYDDQILLSEDVDLCAHMVWYCSMNEANVLTYTTEGTDTRTVFKSRDELLGLLGEYGGADRSVARSE